MYPLPIAPLHGAEGIEMATHGLDCNNWRRSIRERLSDALAAGARPMIVACGIVTFVLGWIVAVGK